MHSGASQHMSISFKYSLIAQYFTHIQNMVQLLLYMLRLTCDGTLSLHDSIAVSVHVATQHINTPRLANVKPVREN